MIFLNTLFNLLNGLVLRLVFCYLVLSITKLWAEPIILVDGLGTKVVLDAPAERVIALSPNLVENITSAGGFDKLIAVVAYSTYPKAAQQLPQVGSYRSFDYETILAMQPDLVVVWHSGNGTEVVKKLRSLGITVLVTDPRTLTDVAHYIRLLGRAMGTESIAEPVAAQYLEHLQQLQEQSRKKRIIDSFYQVWHQPLQTLTGESIVSQIIELCGGRNIYADELGIAPVISIESIIERNPVAIIASQADGDHSPWQNFWHKNWPELSAVQQQRLIDLPADESKRPTVRLLQAADILCKRFDDIRQTLENPSVKDG